MNASLDDMRAQLRPMGERQVKTRLALEKIALLEKLEATADDIEAEYKKLADQYSMEIEKVKGGTLRRQPYNRHCSAQGYRLRKGSRRYHRKDGRRGRG